MAKMIGRKRWVKVATPENKSKDSPKAFISMKEQAIPSSKKFNLPLKIKNSEKTT